MCLCWAGAMLAPLSYSFAVAMVTSTATDLLRHLCYHGDAMENIVYWFQVCKEIFLGMVNKCQQALSWNTEGNQSSLRPWARYGLLNMELVKVMMSSLISRDDSNLLLIGQGVVAMTNSWLILRTILCLITFLKTKMEPNWQPISDQGFLALVTHFNQLHQLILRL